MSNIKESDLKVGSLIRIENYSLLLVTKNDPDKSFVDVIVFIYGFYSNGYTTKRVKSTLMLNLKDKNNKLYQIR